MQRKLYVERHRFALIEFRQLFDEFGYLVVRRPDDRVQQPQLPVEIPVEIAHRHAAVGRYLADIAAAETFLAVFPTSRFQNLITDVFLLVLHSVKSSSR